MTTTTEPIKTVRLKQSTYNKVANLGTLDKTFDDIISQCVNIAEPELLQAKEEEERRQLQQKETNEKR
jgi:hypothetical protein